MSRVHMKELLDTAIMLSLNSGYDDIINAAKIKMS